MPSIRHITRRRVIVAFIALCIGCLGAVAYFRSILPPVEPLPVIDEKPRETYWPISHTLSSAQKSHVLDGEFSIERDVNRFPNGLKAAFARLAREESFQMANPGEKYQVTDVVVEPGLPFRRLVFAGVSNEKYFIHYEVGGIGHSYHIAVFEVDPVKKVTLLWGGPGPVAKDLPQLRTLVAAGAFADDRAYAW